MEMRRDENVHWPTSTAGGVKQTPHFWTDASTSQLLFFPVAAHASKAVLSEILTAVRVGRIPGSVSAAGEI